MMMVSEEFCLEFVGNVPGVGKVYSIDACFDQAMHQFGKTGLTLISMQEAAILREHVAESRQTDLWVREGVLYVPKEFYDKPLRILTRDSFLLEEMHPSCAIRCHKNEKPFSPQFVTRIVNSLEGILASVVDGRTNDPSMFILDGNPTLITQNLGKDSFSSWIFGNSDVAKKYGEHLGSYGFSVLPLEFDSDSRINEHKKPYVLQLSLGWINSSGMTRGIGIKANSRALYRPTKFYGVLTE